MDSEMCKTVLVFLHHSYSEQSSPNAQPLQPIPSDAWLGLAEAFSDQ